MKNLRNTVKATFGRLPTFALAALMAVAMMAQGCLLIVDDDGTLTITNDTNADIVELFVAESSSSSWGAPLALPGGFLAPGEAIEVEVDGGLWDIRAVDNFGSEYESMGHLVVGGITTSMDLDASDEVFTIVEPPAPTTGTLVIVNDIDWGDIETILEGLFIAPASAADWGDNWIEGAPILFGGFATIEDMEAGVYDLQALDQDGDSYVVMGFEVIAGVTNELTLTTSDYESETAVGLLMLNPGVKLRLVRRAEAG